VDVGYIKIIEINLKIYKRPLSKGRFFILILDEMKNILKKIKNNLNE